MCCTDKKTIHKTSPFYVSMVFSDTCSVCQLSKISKAFGLWCMKAKEKSMGLMLARFCRSLNPPSNYH